MNKKDIAAERIWYSGYARPFRESNDKLLDSSLPAPELPSALYYNFIKGVVYDSTNYIVSIIYKLYFYSLLL